MDTELSKLTPGASPTVGSDIKTGQDASACVRALERIEDALLRMEAGEYGYCAACAEQISLERLEADPAAALCGRCARDTQADASEHKPRRL